MNRSNCSKSKLFKITLKFLPPLARGENNLANLQLNSRRSLGESCDWEKAPRISRINDDFAWGERNRETLLLYCTNAIRLILPYTSRGENILFAIQPATACTRLGSFMCTKRAGRVDTYTHKSSTPTPKMKM